MERMGEARRRHAGERNRAAQGGAFASGAMIETANRLRNYVQEYSVPDASALPLVAVEQLARKLRGRVLILDTRPAEQFAALHIRGSIQISLMGNFAGWAAIIIEPTQKLLLIVEDASHAQEARNRLLRVGLGNIIGYSIADGNRWRKAGLKLATISIERSEQVQHTLQSHPSLQLIDVRSRAEWLSGHLPGAISMPLLDFDPKKPVIDPSKPSLVYCHEGFRATTAASILLRKSAADKIRILIDGVEGWSALGLPLERSDRSSH
jgi:hydroxyacylglutathione hydrolase